MKNKVVALILSCVLMLLPAMGLAREWSGTTAVIDGKTADRVHLREKASADSKSLGLYFTGTQVLCELPVNGQWAWVIIGEEAGYMKKEYLQFASDPGTVMPKTQTGVVQNPTGWVNVRSEPSLTGEAVSKLSNGQRVIVLGETNGKWCYIQFGNLYGYIVADFLAVGDVSSFGAYEAVLKNQAAFVYAGNGQSMTIKQMLDAYTEASMTVSHFVLMDIDNDGAQEVILRETMGGYDYFVTVLDQQNGVIYGYELGVRSMGGIKTDGTFSFSSGAGDNGFGAITFNKGSYAIDELARMQSTAYYVNHKGVTRAQFDAALEQQDKKADVTWIPFTAANIEKLLK